ncbi:MAG: hypothetical protein LBF56_04005 [Holosporales bacterium]|jgi:hypothetical protein|nr:hypothetical protein [Holosporales bacterium]
MKHVKLLTFATIGLFETAVASDDLLDNPPLQGDESSISPVQQLEESPQGTQPTDEQITEPESEAVQEQEESAAEAETTHEEEEPATEPNYEQEAVQEQEELAAEAESTGLDPTTPVGCYCKKLEIMAKEIRGGRSIRRRLYDLGITEIDSCGLMDIIEKTIKEIECTCRENVISEEEACAILNIELSKDPNIPPESLPNLVKLIEEYEPLDTQPEPSNTETEPGHSEEPNTEHVCDDPHMQPPEDQLEEVETEAGHESTE